MPLHISMFIGTYYACIAALCCSVSEGGIRFAADTTLQQAAIVLFLIGNIGNFYHHKLLADLRSDPSTGKKYVVPSGGLFCCVAAPHYFFELMSWLAIAFAANHVNVFLVFTSMTSYLSGRAVAQNKWNKEKFKEEWPGSRKNMVPGIF
eukprot:CAMPEP_0198204372 /NCGR_PEP_ID=MMETSP1445-20131203/7775_1 /TAXON_ID=36898 /ORGANISM="Pyramimonas sp., Strain CCMP2087" /LENGTH=148 /DNA_ID=CAMNT_0043876223 /DNA_START=457 /DNA_END=903 /DNA_ORIENTATION=-